GYVIEYTGEALREVSMEERMTICNMSIEGGARAGLISPDEVTFSYLTGRKYAPKDADYDVAVEKWKELATDPGAEFDKVLEIHADEILPTVTWGTNPSMSVTVEDTVPFPEDFNREVDRKAAQRA